MLGQKNCKLLPMLGPQGCKIQVVLEECFVLVSATAEPLSDVCFEFLWFDV